LILYAPRCTVNGMIWTHDGTIRSALWIGGGQWAGKTTVAGLLTDRYGLIHYHYDQFDIRVHEDRRVAARARRGEPTAPPDWEAYWIASSPRETAERTLAGFAESFPWVLDVLRGLVAPRPVLLDGWGLRPELVAAATGDVRRMVVIVPTDGWRLRQAATLPRAGAVSARVSDPALAQRNRLERDRLIAADAVRKAHEHGIPVIEVDGARPPESIADEVADRFRPFLP